WCNVNRS
ncbi:hypothetical protein ACTA71_011798, partial [Dictyostelium dimigraforme]